MNLRIDINLDREKLDQEPGEELRRALLQIVEAIEDGTLDGKESIQINDCFGSPVGHAKLTPWDWAA